MSADPSVQFGGSVTLYNPPSAFDPETACENQLQKFGFPPRPTDRRSAAYSLWAQAFNTKTTYPRFSFTPTGSSTPGDAAALAGSTAGNWSTSRNWSGFLVRTAGAKCISGASGAWTMPAGARPTRATPVPNDDPVVEPPDSVWRYSCWVGLDGTFPYSRALPQIGVDVTVNAENKVSYRAWVQWYAPNPDPDPASPQNGIPLTLIEGFPVNPGDRLAGFATVRGPNVVDVALVNLTSGYADAQGTTYPPPVAALIGLSTVHCKFSQACAVQGATAEWILERPTPAKQATNARTAPWEVILYPLPDFGALTFDILGFQDQATLQSEGQQTRTFLSNADRAFRQISMYAYGGADSPTGGDGPAAIQTVARPTIVRSGGVVRYWDLAVALGRVPLPPDA